MTESPTSTDIVGGQSYIPPYGLYCFCTRDIKNMELLICKDAVSMISEKSKPFYESSCGSVQK